MSRVQKQMDRYREDFAGFKARRADSTPIFGLGTVQVIHWQHPDTGYLSGTFIFHGNRLHAFGDFDDKMYRFNRDVTLGYLKNESIAHFSEKCTTGSDEWDEDEAERRIREYIADFLSECDISPHRKSMLEEISDMEYSEASYGPANAANFASEYDFEGEFFYRAGRVSSHVCVRHLVALKMIADQLEASEC